MGKTHLDISTQSNFGDCPILNWINAIPAYLFCYSKDCNKTNPPELEFLQQKKILGCFLLYRVGQ